MTKWGVRLTNSPRFLTASQTTWSNPGGVGGLVGMVGTMHKPARK